MPALVVAAGGKNDLVFLASRVRPVSYPKNIYSAVADELTELAHTLVEQYQQLGMPAENTPAASYLEASRRCYDHSNHHRAAPQGFAARLLAALQDMGTSTSPPIKHRPNN